MSLTIEVAETHPPQNGRKLAKVKTRTGEEFWIWPDKLGALRVGQRYEIEVAESEFNGRTYRKITKAKQVGAVAPAAPRATTTPANDGGDAERRFVCDMLTAAVRNGAIGFNASDLRGAVAMLRALWRDVAR
jgi:hypothetical protein